MTTSFAKHLSALSQYAHLKDAASNQRRNERLKKINKAALINSPLLIQYVHVLLFLKAYPSNAYEYALAEKELVRITGFLRSKKEKAQHWLQNTGLPHGTIITQFSHDSIRWLLDHPQCKIDIHSFADGKIKLHEVLNMTLPLTEKHIASTGMEHQELMNKQCII